MNELKTLKDLSDGYLSEDGELISKKTLKAEAVKYYFDLKKRKEINETTDEALIIEGAMRWIKHFFNLTEEDLK